MKITSSLTIILSIIFLVSCSKDNDQSNLSSSSDQDSLNQEAIILSPIVVNGRLFFKDYASFESTVTELGSIQSAELLNLWEEVRRFYSLRREAEENPSALEQVRSLNDIVAATILNTENIVQIGELVFHVSPDKGVFSYVDVEYLEDEHANLKNDVANDRVKVSALDTEEFEKAMGRLITCDESSRSSGSYDLYTDVIYMPSVGKYYRAKVSFYNVNSGVTQSFRAECFLQFMRQDQTHWQDCCTKGNVDGCSAVEGEPGVNYTIYLKDVLGRFKPRLGMIALITRSGL